MIELRWLSWDSWTTEKAGKKLQYRERINPPSWTISADLIAIRDEWSEWKDVPTVSADDAQVVR